MLLALTLAGCGSTTASPVPTLPEGTRAPDTTAAAPSEQPAVQTLTPSAAPGFAFDPESIVGYYQSIGYACTDTLPSTQAVGYTFRTCELVDPAGRTRVVGVVIDPAGDLGDAFASVTGATGEDILEPSATLDPFAAFLGAVLGGPQGESMLPWLAGNLGNSYASTTVGDLTLATYTNSPEDHSELFVEIASRGYLDAPRPSGSPAAS